MIVLHICVHGELDEEKSQVTIAEYDTVKLLAILWKVGFAVVFTISLNLYFEVIEMNHEIIHFRLVCDSSSRNVDHSTQKHLQREAVPCAYPW